MNTQDKSLKLAELMGWEPLCDPALIPFVTAYEADGRDITQYAPYEQSTVGLAQFAAILLKFPEVMVKVYPKVPVFDRNHNYLEQQINEDFEPTQANILDSILEMNGVAVE